MFTYLSAFANASAVTEMEIDQGILHSSDPEKHAIAFIRKFSDLRAEDPDAWKFIEMKGNAVDVGIMEMLYQLRDAKIPSVLSEENIFKFEIEFKKYLQMKEIDFLQTGKISYILDTIIFFEKILGASILLQKLGGLGPGSFEEIQVKM